MNPYNWVTRNYKLKHQRDIEKLQSNLGKATSATVYSWIKKRNITKELAGNPRRVLDVGCGWGRELVRFNNAVGVDVCLPFLKTAKNYTSNELVLSDASSLPFKDNSFDLAIMSEVIEHLNNPDEAIKQIKRALKEGGKIIVQTPNKLLTGGKVISKDRGHVHEFTPSELIKFITKHGFKILRRTGSTIPYIPTSSRFTDLNANKCFFKVWKLLDEFIPFKWDIIILAERRK